MSRSGGPGFIAELNGSDTRGNPIVTEVESAEGILGSGGLSSRILPQQCRTALLPICIAPKLTKLHKNFSELLKTSQMAAREEPDNRLRITDRLTPAGGRDRENYAEVAVLVGKPRIHAQAIAGELGLAPVIGTEVVGLVGVVGEVVELVGVAIEVVNVFEVTLDKSQ